MHSKPALKPTAPVHNIPRLPMDLPVSSLPGAVLPQPSALLSITLLMKQCSHTTGHQLSSRACSGPIVAHNLHGHEICFIKLYLQ